MRDIPVFDTSTRKDGTFSRSDFTYDHGHDLYVCPGGKERRHYRRQFQQSRTGINAEGLKRCRASKHDCGPSAESALLSKVVFFSVTGRTRFTAVQSSGDGWSEKRHAAMATSDSLWTASISNVQTNAPAAAPAKAFCVKVGTLLPMY